MKRAGASLATAVLLGMLSVSVGRAQSYGPEEQVLTIGAAEFRERIGGDPPIDSDGYVYAGIDIDYWAPLALPEGALLEKICLYANDSDPNLEVIAYLFAVKLVPGGEDPFYAGLGFFVESDSDGGYGSFCATTSPSYTVRGKFDIDGDGITDAVAYYAYVLLQTNAQSPFGFGGLQITWKRQVSPPTSQTFEDVPTSDQGFDYIEALAASGITAGCSVHDYCPDATLTRRQMAVFLAKALGLHWSD
jgi:S-layer homology domain